MPSGQPTPSVQPDDVQVGAIKAGAAGGICFDRVPVGRFGFLSVLLGDALAEVSDPGRRTRVLDCGGGTGAFAVPLAGAGAEVTVLDISADALATLRRRADEAGVGDRIHPLQADAEMLSAQLIAGAQPSSAGADATTHLVDLVLAHGILEAVDDARAAIAGMASVLRPGGLLSILIGNPSAAVVARALAGDPAGALRELRGLDEPTRLGPDAVTALCLDAGLVVEARHGIGVFADLVPGATLERPGAREALAELDAEASARNPFAELAGRIHLWVRRPAG